MRVSERTGWGEESQLRLEQSVLYKQLRELCSRDPAGADVMTQVDAAARYAVQRTKLVVRHMKNTPYMIAITSFGC